MTEYFRKWALAFLVVGIAGYIRIAPANRVFPAQGDAAHFVQCGMAVRYGGISQISGYWSLGPQLLAAAADHWGLDPARTLQASTILFGLLLVAGIVVLAMTLTGHLLVGLIAGLLVATSPALVASSTAGLAETPHMATALWGFALCYHAFKSRKGLWIVPGALVLAIDLYYRPFDLALLLGAFVPFLAFRFRKLPPAFLWKTAAGGVLIFLLAGLPFLKITADQKSGSAGQSKLVNLAFAPYGFDPKVMWEAKGIDTEDNPLFKEIQLLRTVGTPRYLWMHRGQIARRYLSNMAQAARQMNAYAFHGSFRMGLVWFALAAVLLSAAAFRGGMAAPALYAWASMLVVPLALSIGWVHPRWTMQCMPFFFLLAGMGLARVFEEWPGSRRRCALLALLLLFAGMNAREALRRLEGRWRDRNIPVAAERLRQFAGEDDKLMCFGPELPVAFFRTNLLNYLEIPYGPVDRVALWADRRDVDIIALCSSRFPGFPIHRIASDPASVPEGWTELDRLVFEKHTRFGLETDQYVFYRRTPAAP
jgi:hypothetical protein